MSSVIRADGMCNGRHRTNHSRTHVTQIMADARDTTVKRLTNQSPLYAGVRLGLPGLLLRELRALRRGRWKLTSCTREHADKTHWTSARASRLGEHTQARLGETEAVNSVRLNARHS